MKLRVPVRSGNCMKCGTYRERLQRDHIIPRFKNGSDDESNIQHLCANCHEDKSKLEMHEWYDLNREMWREKGRERWKDPEYRARLTQHARKKPNRATTPEARQKMSESSKKRWQDPAYRAKQIRDGKARWKDPAYRANVTNNLPRGERNASSRPEVRAKISASVTAYYERKKQTESV